ncbi:double zinc ribbon domain-containing protein [Albidovulum sp.]|uniref:double zinc ribbon domain-containing protein n=1 Tax=Albidovulum sp. TaxID=1872424 RepID=UPI00352962B2
MMGQTRMLQAGLQSILSLAYPPQCISCETMTERPFALCAGCWSKTPFIVGLACDKCGTPLPGEDDGRPELCDDCLATERPWDRGRAAMIYRDNARDLVLALKHADRLEIGRAAGPWLFAAARPILVPGVLIAPVPLHRQRYFRRTYNQSAILAGALARAAGAEWCPDLLLRSRATPSQEGRDRDARFVNLAGAVRTNPRRADRVAGRDLLIVDDVMTSGATFSAAAEAGRAAGAGSVSVLALARVAKDA